MFMIEYMMQEEEWAKAIARIAQEQLRGPYDHDRIAYYELFYGKMQWYLGGECLFRTGPIGISILDVASGIDHMLREDGALLRTEGGQSRFSQCDDALEITITNRGGLLVVEADGEDKRVVTIAEFFAGGNAFVRSFARHVRRKVPVLLKWESGQFLTGYIEDDEGGRSRGTT